MGSERKTPIRTCVSCRSAVDKSKLIRIVRAGDQVKLDPSGKAPGRGAYLCGAKECLASAIKNNRLSRALRCSVPADVIVELEGLAGSGDAGNENE